MANEEEEFTTHEDSSYQRTFLKHNTDNKGDLGFIFYEIDYLNTKVA
ncbi:hypothetical protein NSTC745_00499 [Nostoc sp. DSM 114161]|jgi:hypothetical protein